MKKLFGLISASLVVACVCVTVSTVSANQTEPEIGFDKTTCYKTFSSGTTNFVKCSGCTETTGTSLTDSDTCKP